MYTNFVFMLYAHRHTSASFSVPCSRVIFQIVLFRFFKKMYRLLCARDTQSERCMAMPRNDSESFDYY